MTSAVLSSASQTPAARRPRRLAICHLGAREHYAWPLMAQANGQLVRFITDVWLPLSPLLRSLAAQKGSSAVARLAGRFRPEIPSHKVVALYALALQSALRRRLVRNREELYRHYVSEGAAFAQGCIPYLDADHDAYFGFCSAALEALRFERRARRTAVVGQFDPARVEHDIVREEEARHPGLAIPEAPIPDVFFRRLEAEWDEADRIFVNSTWSRKALVAQGVPDGKLRVVPLAFTLTPALAPRPRPGGRLRVLWLGALCLRKGLPYAIEAARLLERAPVEFSYYGPLAVNRARLSLPPNATYHGPLARSLAPSVYRAHDILLLPTLSDGFAITQIEAMSYGLPVIATPCCGEVVHDGVNGWIVPPRDAAAVAAAISEILDNPERYESMSAAALTRSRDFVPERVWPLYQRAIEN